MPRQAPGGSAEVPNPCKSHELNFVIQKVGKAKRPQRNRLHFGAIQYWLYSRQPCGDPRCQDCMPISTAQGRMAELRRLIDQLASESEYFHTPTDANAGRA